MEELNKLRVSMGSAFFTAQYLQSPTPPGGGLVKIAWFPRFDLENQPRFERIVLSWDTANSAKDLSSFSVCTTWGVRARKAYLIHVLRKRMEFPELRRAILTQARELNASVVLIEDAASGASLLQDLRSELSSVRGCKPTGDKIMRMNAQTAHIENGFVFLPREAPWLPDLEHELVMFPKGRYADQIDSISQALEFIFTVPQIDVDDWIKIWTGNYNREPESVGSNSPPRNVKAVSTVPNSTLKANSGRLVKPDADGVFWLTENEAQSVRFIPTMKIIS